MKNNYDTEKGEIGLLKKKSVEVTDDPIQPTTKHNDSRTNLAQSYEEYDTEKR